MVLALLSKIFLGNYLLYSVNCGPAWSTASPLLPECAGIVLIKGASEFLLASL